MIARALKRTTPSCHRRRSKCRSNPIEMSETSNDDSKLIAQLKGKLWYCIEKQMGEETPFDTSYTPQYTNALVEMCYMQLIDMGKDLEAFARHAGRETIRRDDMALLLRKTPQLEELIVPK